MPFQAYRLRLVEMLDDLLNWLEKGVFPLFVLDGQTVLLEDVFAVRPDFRERVAALVKAGKIKVGPWYTMPDLFLARPESLIRNLQRGIAMAEALGGASRVGYVPDSFGHFAQLPQLLNGFRIESYLFMRGMPEALRDARGALFVWRAPDHTSQLTGIYLREGYFPLGALGQESFHGRYDGLAANLEGAQKRLSDALARLAPVQKNPVFVLPAGGDHLPARADLKPVIDALNAQQQDIELRFGSFEDALSAIAPHCADLPVHEGDLLGQADHPLLRNVLSSRIDLKILNHKAQSLLLGVVEPLLAWSRLQGLPLVHDALLQNAWDALLKNHAHDDICGCSVDDVHVDNIQRFHEIMALGREVVTRQLEHAVQKLWGSAPHARSSRIFVFNPHPWAHTAEVQARVLMPDDGGEFSPESKAREIILRDSQRNIKPVQILATHCKDIRNNYLETTWGRSYTVAFSAELPPLGFSVFTLEEGAQELDSKSLAELVAAERFAHLALNDLPRELREGFVFELEADLGDGYSFGPCPEIPTQHAQLVSAQRDLLQPHVLHLQYEIAGFEFIRRDDLKNKPLQDCLGPVRTMPLQVVARRKTAEDSSVWELSLNYTNIFSDSRLRIIFPASQAVEAVWADAQARWEMHTAQVPTYEIWPGPLAEPRYPGEKPYPVHHTNDGVVLAGSAGLSFCGGAGVHEFELMERAGQKSVALTLHRAVGFLSVRGGRIRSCQAGPQRPTPDAQMQRKIEHTLAFGERRDSKVTEAFRTLKEILQPTWVQELPVLPAPQFAPQENGAAQSSDCFVASLCDVADTPLQIMACRAESQGQGVLLRLLNPTALTIEVALKLHPHVAQAQLFALDDLTPQQTHSTKSAAGLLNATFKPNEIKTWKLSLC
jgi:mannosylglycerate hydrolase